MSIQEKQAKLMSEAQALNYFYNVNSHKLRQAFAAYEAAYNSPAHIEPEEFTELLNAIDAEIEDLCLASHICQETLEELMEADPQYKTVAI